MCHGRYHTDRLCVEQVDTSLSSNMKTKKKTKEDPASSKAAHHRFQSETDNSKSTHDLTQSLTPLSEGF